MRSRLLFSLVCLSVFALSACKIKITVPEGGVVLTQSEAFTCDTSASCTIDVVDLFFDQTFVAVPAAGYIFQGWRTGNKALCGGKREACRLYTSTFAGNQNLLAVLNSDDVFTLEPNFETGTETAIGRWVGQWTNNSFGSVGAVTLTLTNKANNKVEVTVDLDGFVGGLMDPEPQTVMATQRANGTIDFDGTVDVMGSAGSLVFSLTSAGVLTIAMNDIPITGFEDFSAQGNLGGGSGFLNYEITFSPMGSAVGTVSATKT